MAIIGNGIYPIFRQTHILRIRRLWFMAIYAAMAGCCTTGANLPPKSLDSGPVEPANQLFGGWRIRNTSYCFCFLVCLGFWPIPSPHTLTCSNCPFLGRLGTLPRVFFALFVVALLTRTANGISRARQICIDIAIPWMFFDLFDLDEGEQSLEFTSKKGFL